MGHLHVPGLLTGAEFEWFGYGPKMITPKAGSTARPCGRNQNNESEHPPPIDVLGVETLCLRGPGEMLQKNVAKKTRNYDVALQSYAQFALLCSS